MLGQVANYAAVISCNTITKLPTSLYNIWAKLRQHYGFQATGAHFLDLSYIRLQPDEIHQDIFQRLLAFFEDNILVTGCGITHHSAPITTNADLTPSLENNCHTKKIGLPSTPFQLDDPGVETIGRRCACWDTISHCE